MLYIALRAATLLLAGSQQKPKFWQKISREIAAQDPDPGPGNPKRSAKRNKRQGGWSKESGFYFFIKYIICIAQPVTSIYLIILYMTLGFYLYNSSGLVSRFFK